MFEKALTLNADTLILDLEDSVTSENKKQPEERFATGLNRQTLARRMSGSYQSAGFAVGKR